MSEDAWIILIVAILAVALIAWVIQLASGLILIFTYFVMGLPTLVAILMFVLFPPSLLVFLVGIAMMKLGVGESNDSDK